MDRGQTTLDFAVGVSIFLMSIVFVFAFVPGTLQPFTQSAQDETAGSDRVADLLVEDLLTADGDPYILDGSCTAALMADRSGSGCGFDGGNLSTRLDLPRFQSINVTMRGDPGGGHLERLCWNDADEVVVGATNASCDVALATGEEPPTDTDSVVTARRVVAIQGIDTVVEVRLW